MVKYEFGIAEVGRVLIGVIVADLPGDYIVAPAVSILWGSGEIVERVPARILEVISESR
jgi:hypothetical protein